MNLNEYFSKKIRNDYQREYFDHFLKKIGFNYNVPSIHIAGTNGKGSTATYLASIYRHSGLKVGLFISPALVNINEMISINGELISDSNLEKYINEYHKQIDKFDLSAFEIQTFIALKYFADNNCDISIIECGMGGETDATNVFTPILSIITSVSLEHTMFLGRTLSEIALQKCGIIKENVPVILGSNNEDVVNTVYNYAREYSSKVFNVVEPSSVIYSSNGYSFSYGGHNDVKIQSHALYSVKDACLALEAVNVLSSQYAVSEENIIDGLWDTNLPARLSFVRKNPLVIIDGGHNPEAIYNLCISLNNIANSTPIHTVFASFKDKNIERMRAMLGEISADITLTSFDHPRARSYEEYFLFAEDYTYKDDAIRAIREAMTNYPDDIVLITGSLAFAGYIFSLFEKGEFDE